jgi:hypothetical protein
MRLWDVATVRPIGQPMNSHTNLMLNVTFSPGGLHLLSTGVEPDRRLWPAPALTAWPNMVCTKLTQNMSQHGWREWVSSDIEYSRLCPDLPVAPDAPGG